MWDLAVDHQGTLLRTLDYAAGSTGTANQPMVTDWILAAVGVLTLVTAIVAGLGAWRAAHWTKQQAIASRQQVDIAGENLAVAKKDAEAARALADDQRRAASLATRRLAEDRVDAQMPTVLIRATPGTGSRRLLEQRVAGVDDWTAVEDELEFKDGDATRALRVSVTFHLENLSDRIARVVLFDSVHGESVAGGRWRAVEAP
jgi:hypothetical protein